MNSEDPTTKRALRPPPFLPIELNAYDVKTSQPLPDGSFVMQLHVRLPPGLLKGASQILGPNGQPVNALQGAVAGIPTVKIVFRTQKLEENFITQALARTESDLQILIDSGLNPNLPLPVPGSPAASIAAASPLSQEPADGSGK